MKVLISGAGIAGTTLAYWLVGKGIDVTLVERAKALRTGGYIIDFWGAGYDIAERMGLLPELHRLGYVAQEVRSVGSDGKRVAGFSAKAFARIAQGRFVSLARSDLAAVIFGKVEGKVEMIFGDCVDQLEETDDAVVARFHSGRTGRFDLVVGADGLHSRIRELVMGPEEQFEKYLGYKVAAFEAKGYRPRDELVYVMYTEIGQQVARFALRDDKAMFLFIFRDDEPANAMSEDVATQKAILHRRFGQSGWECAGILAALDEAEELYFDRVSQIRIGGPVPAWSRGRTVLLGDAASCVSFLAGQGAALAMIAAYLLASELSSATNGYRQAFLNYETVFRPFVEAKQKAALRFGGAFAPKSRLGLFVRNRMLNLMNIPLVADLTVAGSIKDKITLPEIAIPRGL